MESMPGPLKVNTFRLPRPKMLQFKKFDGYGKLVAVIMAVSALSSREDVKKA